jgi:hypothetical protein
MGRLLKRGRENPKRRVESKKGWLQLEVEGGKVSRMEGREGSMEGKGKLCCISN